MGFTTQISTNVGSRVRFKIRTPASNYRIDIYRMGYYQGNGARHITEIDPAVSLPQSQPACLTVPSTGLVDCGNWAETAHWDVPADAVSGIYFAHLVRNDNGDDNHIVFVVRNDASTSALIFQTSDTTWQAYNDWGGNSFYRGQPEGRAYKVSYNRPFRTREGTVSGRDWVFSTEYPTVRWLERNGYDVSYQAGIDTDRRGDLLRNHRAFLSVGHDEYWTGQQRANVEAARDAGVHLAFLSGNEVYWKTRWERGIDSSAGDGRTLVCYKETWAEAKIDPSPEWTGTWRDPRFSPPSDGGRPENELTGSLYKVQSFRGAITVPAADGKLRLWKNTSVANLAPGQTATLADGVLGYEFNESPDNGFQPDGLVRLSSTTVDVQEYLTDFGKNVAPGRATHHLTMYRHPTSRAIVFGAGTIQWAWGLDGNHDGSGGPADRRIQQATVNILGEMGVHGSTLQGDLVRNNIIWDLSPPNITITSPAPGATLTGDQVTMITGTATDVGGGRVGSIEVSVDGQTWHPATGREQWSYAWMPTGSGPVTIRVRATDDGGFTSQTPATRSVVTSCPCTLFGNTTPALLAEPDPGPLALGTVFRSEVAGEVTGVRFFKGPGNGGTHRGSLWTEDGTRLAQVTFQNETASGWQTASFSSPVPIQAGQNYVVSYHAPLGHYAADRAFFLRGGHDRPPLYAPSNDEGGGNGRYMYGGDAFPAFTYAAENYWVDAVFEPAN